MNDDSKLANLFAAFSHPSRIAILRGLLPHEPNGQKFGELTHALNISPSTLTHHLREMENAGVLTREAMGRSTKFRLNLNVLDEAVSHLTALCCSNVDAPISKDGD